MQIKLCYSSWGCTLPTEWFIFAREKAVFASLTFPETFAGGSFPHHFCMITLESKYENHPIQKYMWVCPGHGPCVCSLIHIGHSTAPKWCLRQLQTVFTFFCKSFCYPNESDSRNWHNLELHMNVKIVYLEEFVPLKKSYSEQLSNCWCTRTICGNKLVY